MGQEAECTVTVGTQTSKGRAYLETDALIFRGEFRLSIPYSHITSLRARDGRLIVGSPAGTATFLLGSRAEKWAHAIQHPKSLIDKLGVKPGDRVAVLGVADVDFLVQVRSRAAAIPRGRLAKDLDVIFFQADRAPALGRLTGLRAYLKPSGGIWVVAPKAVNAITEAGVLAAGRKAGLVDVKVVRFSQTHTAHKFVIPKAKRRL